MTESAWAVASTKPQASDRKAELYASWIPTAWYVACVRREEQARDDLRELGIGEVWMPECRVVVTRRRTRAIVDGPLFPGYLFVRGVLTDEWLSSVLSVRDVEDLLRMGNRPVAACDSQIVKLQRLMAESGGRLLIERGVVKRGFNHPVDEPFFEGQVLRILDGPFAGFNALYREVAGKERIKIFVDIFGRTNEVTLDEASVEAIA